MTHRNRITVSKFNPDIGGGGGGVILPTLPVGILLITQKR